MQLLEQYCEDIKSGKIASGNSIKKAVERFERFKNRDDIYFDEEAVERCISFVATLKHFLGKSAGKQFVLEPWQQFIVANIVGLKWKATGLRVCRETYIQMARKALALDTPIPTPDGMKTIADIKPGDFVFGSDGIPTAVKSVTDVFGGVCYRLTFEDGETVVADAQHQWYAKKRHRKEGVYTTEQIVSGGFKHYRNNKKGVEYLWRVPMNKPLNYGKTPELPMDPYVLGLWLGDGTSKKPEFTVCGDDKNLYDYVTEKYGQPKVRNDKRYHKNTLTLNYSGEKGKNNSRLRHELCAAGVFGNKHIPEIYLYASIEDRLALLQGLMDTDGYVSDRGMCQFCQSNLIIVENFCKLLSSLGIKYSVKTKIPKIKDKEYKKAYLINFFTDKTFPCFRLKRKFDRLKEHLNKRMGWKSIVDIEKVEDCPVKCIEVSNENHQFLFGEHYTVTHNCGKTALLAALALYFLIADGEASPQLVAAANSTSQAHIIFDYVTKFAAGLDSTKKILKPYRDTLKCPSNDGYIKVISSDASRADGLNLSVAILDEFHEQKDRKLYDVLRSSQGQRTQPLMTVITSAGYSTISPCHDMYNLGIEVLNGIKEMDNFFPFIYELDPEDDWKDPKNFQKCQPNLGITVTEEFMLQEINKAEMDSTALNGVLVKTFNKWTDSLVTWIPTEIVVKTMEKVNLEDYRGKSCILGMDLGSVSDFTAISVMIPPEEGKKAVFKSWVFLPNDTIINHPHEMLYRDFIRNNEMIVTEGNVTNYDYIIAKIGEINSICPIVAISSDMWNATQVAINLTNLGYNVVPQSQAIGAYNSATKEMERIIKSGDIIIDKSKCTLFCFSNSVLHMDHNGNAKVTKESNYKKVDIVLSMTNALAYYIKNPISNDFEITVL